MSCVVTNCLNCNQQFKALKREINRGNGKFCCRKCSSSYNGRKIRESKIPNTACAYCQNKFYKNTSKKRRSKSGLFFCCRAHKDAAQKIGGIKEIQPSHYGTTASNYRDVAFRVYPKICMKCGFDHPAAIQVHHIDHDRTNNKISNLEVLCANCHSIEHYNEEFSGPTGVRSRNSAVQTQYFPN